MLSYHETESWLFKPKEHFNASAEATSEPINLWLREIFDSPDSPLFLHRDNLVAFVDSLTENVDEKRGKRGLTNSESLPALTKGKSLSRLCTSELDAALTSSPVLEPRKSVVQSLNSLNNCVTAEPRQNLMRSTDLSDIQSMARIEEDRLKAHVAALSKRHTGSQNSIHNPFMSSSLGSSCSDIAKNELNFVHFSPNASYSCLNQSYPTTSFKPSRYGTINLSERKTGVNTTIKSNLNRQQTVTLTSSNQKLNQLPAPSTYTKHHFYSKSGI